MFTFAGSSSSSSTRAVSRPSSTVRRRRSPVSNAGSVRLTTAQGSGPRCAVARRTLPAFETGERRLRTVLDGLDTAHVELEESLLANVNTPADLDTLVG